MKTAKIAIVYDWMDKSGGVERVLLTLHETFPDADFYTSYYDEKKASWAKGLKIHTSFIQKLPGFIKKSRLLSLILYPLAFESFNFSEYQTVISVTSSFAKGVITKPQTKHICYLLTPPRYIWGNTKVYTDKNIFTRIGSTVLKKYLQEWDFIAAQRVDSFISISKLVSERCKKYYKRDSKVIYPPFDTDYWYAVKRSLKSKDIDLKGLPDKSYFLVVSRLEPYKRVDLAVKVFKDLKDKTLVIVGTGGEEQKLRKMAGKNVIFLDNLSENELGWVYSHAEGLIMSQEEDFGYVALEAQFFGCPVLSYKKSGAFETVIEDQTGLFFTEQTTAALAKKLQEFDIISYKLKENCLRSGEKHMKTFSKALFKSEFISSIS